MDKSSILLTISEKMSDEYQKRYGRVFYHFHNPINTEVLSNFSNRRKNYSIQESKAFKIIHAGRVGRGIQTSLITVAKAVDELNNEGEKIELIIQTSYVEEAIKKNLSQYKSIKINKPLEYSDIPELLYGADLLLLCNDFDEDSINFLKYSMPTKVPEYMFSKTPIFVFCNPGAAVYEHALRYHWAYLLGVNDINKVKLAIIELRDNAKLRETIAASAFEYAKTNYDSKIVTEKFRDVFMKPLLENIHKKPF
jgi:glycosyltransferase involved in cell wall biosynthesis